MASSLKFSRNGAVGFIDWLDGLLAIRCGIIHGASEFRM
jgi:hypothetical protein